MANLLNFKSSRSPLENGLWSLLVFAISFLAFGAIPTQWFAQRYNYDPQLGGGLLHLSFGTVYLPTEWIRWGWQLGDVQHLRKSVQTMSLIGEIATLLSVFFSMGVAYRLSKSSVGMEGLHGTAHFAERDEVDLTGFISAPGHTAKGVVLGSVMFDADKKVIHPHHPKYHRRYVPVMKWGEGRHRFRRIQVRDAEGRPRFKPRKSVVKHVELLRDGANTHIFGFCPTRSGKGVGMVVPTLLTWPSSVMVNDPKGEAFALTAGFRAAAGQHVIKLEPACTDGSSARWNPLAEIRINTHFDVADAQMIMSMACDPKGDGLEDYFDKAGYEFMTAVALHVRYAGQDGSLAGCAKFLGDPQWDSDKQMYTEMINYEHDPSGKMGWIDTLGKATKTHAMIANAAKTMLNKEDRERSGVLSVAKSLLSLYLDPIVASNTSHSDFLARDLMTSEKPVSLYYVVPSDQMVRLTPLTRLFYSIFIRRNAAEMKFEGGRSVKSYTHPLLMIIDEAASLGKLPILQEALGYVAGYGIRMFILVQDIIQIEDLYGDKQSFDSGAESRVAYAPAKIETAEKLARMTGKTTVTEEKRSHSFNMFGFKRGDVSTNTDKIGRDLVTADEFMSLDDQDLILFVKGKPPIYGRKAFYFEHPVLQGRAEIPPPTKSAVLRVQPTEVPTQAPAKVETVADKWAASRAALARQVGSAQQGAADPDGGPIERRVASDDSQAANRPRSRYADTVQTISPEERQKVQDLVANSVVVDRVTSISAF